MSTIGAAAFKEKCLALLDELDDEGLVITKHGRPIARVIRYEADPRALIGSLRDRLKIQGDVLSTGVEWDADGQP